MRLLVPTKVTRRVQTQRPVDKEKDAIAVCRDRKGTLGEYMPVHLWTHVIRVLGRNVKGVHRHDPTGG